MWLCENEEPEFCFRSIIKQKKIALLDNDVFNGTLGLNDLGILWAGSI